MQEPPVTNARFAQAVTRIFDGHGTVADGKILELYLAEVAMTLGRYDAQGIIVDRDTHLEFEGKRALAVHLLGCRTEAAKIGKEEEQE